MAYLVEKQTEAVLASLKNYSMFCKSLTENTQKEVVLFKMDLNCLDFIINGKPGQLGGLYDQLYCCFVLILAYYGKGQEGF